MFGDILIVLSGCANDPATIDMGVYIAKLESARLSGLYISSPGARGKDFRIAAYQSEFDEKCLSHRIEGSFSVAFTKNPIHQIFRMIRFADLVILSIKNKRRNPIHISRFVKQCPTPLITINTPILPILKRCLVIDNNKLNFKLSLEMSIYMSEFWKIVPLVLINQGNKYHSYTYEKDLENLDEKNNRLEYSYETGLKTSDIVSIAVKNRCQLIMFTGYESNFFKKLIHGCRNEEIIYHSPLPLFFCR